MFPDDQTPPHENRRGKRHERTGPRSPYHAVVIGVLIATFGVTLLANNLGWADMRSVMRQFWPVALVIFGIVSLFANRPGSHFWGLVMIAAGIWIYASMRGWITVPFWAVFGPTLLVLLGGMVVWRAMSAPKAPAADVESSGYINTFAVMSGSEHKPTSVPFEGANLGAVMGGVKLDLIGAEMKGDTVVIDVFSVMGGIEIFAPRDWEVALKVMALMGASVDKRRPAAPGPRKTLIVRGFVLMGGVEIKD